MRFVCDSCNAQYMISDDKVGAKGVKVRCKKCSHVILVRKGQETHVAPAPTPPAPSLAQLGLGEDTQATQVLMNPLGDPAALAAAAATDGGTDTAAAPSGSEAEAAAGFFSGVEEDEIGAAFDSVLGGGAPGGDGTAGADSAAAPNGHALGDSDDDRLSTRVLDAELLRKLAVEAGSGLQPSSDEAEPKKEDTPDWYVAIDEKQVGPLTVQKVKDLWDRGELGPDSLCWKAGMGDWQALSDVAELASVLAPQPKKPLVVGPAPLNPGSGSGGMVPVSVESAFSAGGLTKTVRGEGAMLAGAPGGDEELGWKPSAASALASLVADEINALTQPKPRAQVEAPSPEATGAGVAAQGASAVAVRGLLDLPAPNAAPPGGNTQPAAPASAVATAAVQLPVAGSGMPSPSAFGPEPHAAPAPLPVAYPSPPAYTQPPAYAPYPPPQAPNRTGLYVLLGLVAVLLLILTAVVANLVGRQSGEERVSRQEERAVVVSAPPNKAPEPSKVPEFPKPSEAAKAPAEPAATPAPVPAPTPALVAEAVPKPAEPPSVKDAEVAPKGDPALDRTSSRSEATRKDGARAAGTHRERAEVREPEPKDVARDSARTSPASNVDGSDDEFCREFGCDDKKAAPKSAPKQAKAPAPSVYVPPAPGSADVPNSLSQSDIMAVVLQNKPAIVQCVTEQKKKEPGMSGRLVMRWTILTSGKTSSVQVRSEEFRSTYMATCIGGLIKGWKFPRHKTQGDPIDFPFTF